MKQIIINVADWPKETGSMTVTGGLSTIDVIGYLTFYLRLVEERSIREQLKAEEEESARKKRPAKLKRRK